LVCNHWVRQEFTFESDLGETVIFVRLVENTMPYHVAIHRLEHFISRIVTANFRKSWVLNGLLNHSRFTPYYWMLKAKVFRADEVITQ